MVQGGIPTRRQLYPSTKMINDLSWLWNLGGVPFGAKYIFNIQVFETQVTEWIGFIRVIIFDCVE